MLLGFECTINPQNLMKIVGAIFKKNNFFFLCELPLILGVDRKQKNELKIQYLQGDPRYRMWTRSAGWFRRYVRRRDGQQIKNYFSSFRDFSGKIRCVILLLFECTINPQNLIKIVGAIFEKIKIVHFFSRELPLILGVGGNLKKLLEIFTRGL